MFVCGGLVLLIWFVLNLYFNCIVLLICLLLICLLLSCGRVWRWFLLLILGCVVIFLMIRVICGLMLLFLLMVGVCVICVV